MRTRSAVSVLLAVTLLAAGSSIVFFPVLTPARVSDRSNARVTSRLPDEGMLHGAAPLETHVPEAGAAQGDPRLLREARRLGVRLAGVQDAPPADVLATALAGREKLLAREATLSLVTGDTSSGSVWVARVADHPDWLRLDATPFSAVYSLDAAAIERDLPSAIPSRFAPPQQAVITAMETGEKGVVRAKTDARPMSGYLFDVHAATLGIVNRLTGSASGTLTVPLRFVQGSMLLSGSGGTPEILTLLATGLSNFSGSPENRIFNVKKVIRERLDGVVIQPGEIFSFNATLGGPVTHERGWIDGLGLFGGGAAMTPGAGICQGATTVYRAAILAGLPIVERVPHSLYVDHYEPYGVGVDATIFPGTHDLRFRNDTPGIIVMQTYITGEDVFVSFYGKSDARAVTMEGPYFPATAPSTFRKAYGGLAPNQIGWVRHITYADGQKTDVPIFSTYQKFSAAWVAKRFKDTTKGITELEMGNTLTLGNGVSSAGQTLALR